MPLYGAIGNPGNLHDRCTTIPGHQDEDSRPPGIAARAERAYQPINLNHSHAAIMTKTVQIVAAVRGILNLPVHAFVPQSRVPTQFRPVSIFPHTSALRR